MGGAQIIVAALEKGVQLQQAFRNVTGSHLSWMHSQAVISHDVQPIRSHDIQPIRCSECDHMNIFCLPLIQLKQVLTDQTEELRSTRVEGLRRVRGEGGGGRKDKGNMRRQWCGEEGKEKWW